ncbi:BON domain-containing protein [Thalassococcus lentus]|uniref:BON domain-containing protein n=1 Tax=Thalassococcus lentus TaxID=1210524 RepID=A0ABT4XT91_9RHOB|nr:BON domain-containing protein [Thalassococcus lentus]MDA7425183.1 BON domain-containing protein [Thalassococcus lentus]
MRDFFAIVAILFAVITLGVFQVPDKNALVSAGIRAEAEAALYQQRHPISVEVEGRVITASGRVESDDEARAVVAKLGSLEGVDAVVSKLDVLPRVAPFLLKIDKDSDDISLNGHVPVQALNATLSKHLETDVDLPTATGAPDLAWVPVAERGAEALGLLLKGEMRLEDRVFQLTGTAHLPAHLEQVETILADLPDDYSVSLSIDVLDDGLPYSLFMNRDPYMGLRVSAKLPPSFDVSLLDAIGVPQDQTIALAPLPLNQPEFGLVAELAIGIMKDLPQGTVGVGPRVLSVQSGPVPEQIAQSIEALRADLPPGWTMQLALVPEDSGDPLALRAEWSGETLVLTGRVPSDFDEIALAQDLNVTLASALIERSPYPDLDGWSDSHGPGLRALVLLQQGSYEAEGEAKKLTGIAADPQARRLVRQMAQGVELGQLDLKDDGSPAVFSLRYDAATGAVLDGKLPADLSRQAISEAIGLQALRGNTRIAPDGNGSKVISLLKALQPWLAEVDAFLLAFDQGSVQAQILATPGSNPEQLRTSIGRHGARVTLEVLQSPPPTSGTIRNHVVLDLPQVATDGYWLPSLGLQPERGVCLDALQGVPAVPFVPGRTTFMLGSARPIARLAAVARSCVNVGGLTLTITAEAASAEFDVLNRQLSRRRAEALRDALIERGVAEQGLVARGSETADQDRILYAWQ